MESLNTLTTGEAAVAGGFLGAFFACFLVFVAVVAVFTIIAGWKIFAKAGEKGWKILIPIYNSYIALKIVGMNFWGWFCSILGCSLIATLFGGLVYENTSAGYQLVSANPVGYIFLLASGILSLILGILFCVRLAKSFKKGIGFTLGLIFLPFIFEMILAFGSAKYDKKIALKK